MSELYTVDEKRIMTEEDISSVISEDDETAGENALAKKKAENAEQERKNLARRETRAVGCLRLFVFIVLVGTAVLVCIGLYEFTRRDEQTDFEYVFQSSAERVQQSFHDSVTRLLVGVDAMSVSITSYALATGATFPNVTIPDHELRGANTRVLTKSVAANFFPLVSDDDRKGWEAYATEMQTVQNLQMKSFQAENQYVARQDANFGLEPVKFVPPSGDSPLFGRPFSPELTQLQGGVQPEGTGPYLPFWQTSPALPAKALPTVNILTFPPLAPAVSKVIETELAYLSNAVKPSAMFEMFLSRGQYRHQKETFLGDAATPLVYPVFDNFTPQRKLVGCALSNIYWRLHFENILPSNARGIIAVLSNNVNQSFTYQIDGEDAIYLGAGDFHEPRFDRYEVSADISTHLKDHRSVESQGYTAVPLTEEGVQYTLKVYPSEDMESEYLSNKPVIFASIVAAVFGFTCLVFSTYNILVERRQKVVMDRAVKSSAVVSALFPENVKEQLINQSAHGKKKSASKAEAWKAEQQKKDPELPLADKFPETTIMFADIAGFTSWSSDREPEQVFKLLETLYHSFDNLAAKRDVFKVETIGDCYLAVTGLPKPQPDHAIRMVKFARDCMRKVNTLTNTLAETLGDDTTKLSFRVGLHSGPVTAGVLRGDKTRFQLFGDTVNTAARMESNGVKKRIHVSQATADELVKSGQADWLVPREEKIFAKGKGYLQTYLLDVEALEASRAQSVTATSRRGSIASRRSSINSSRSGDEFADDTMSTTHRSSTHGDFDDIPYAVEGAQADGSTEEEEN